MGVVSEVGRLTCRPTSHFQCAQDRLFDMRRCGEFLVCGIRNEYRGGMGYSALGEDGVWTGWMLFERKMEMCIATNNLKKRSIGVCSSSSG